MLNLKNRHDEEAEVSIPNEMHQQWLMMVWSFPGVNASGVRRVGTGGVRGGPNVGKDQDAPESTNKLKDRVGPSLLGNSSTGNDPGGIDSELTGESQTQVVTELDKPLGISPQVWLRLSWLEERPGHDGVKERGIERLIILR